MFTLDTAIGPPADLCSTPKIGAPAIAIAAPRLTVDAGQRRG